jgi:retinol dehydrogenase-12
MVIVVGTNVGLGYEGVYVLRSRLLHSLIRYPAAKKFARMNPGKLILACRNQTRGDGAVKGMR